MSNWNKLVDEWTDLGNKIQALIDQRNMVADEIAAIDCQFKAGDIIQEIGGRKFVVKAVVGNPWGGSPKFAVRAIMLKKDGTESLVTKEIRHYSIDNYRKVDRVL